MFRWCAKHRKLVMFLWSGPISAVYWVLFLYIESSILIPAVFTFIMVFTTWGFVNSCAGKLLSIAEKSLTDQCDPYPLLKETEDQMSYNRSKIYEQLLLINYCVALRNIGEYNKVLEILKKVNLINLK